ncbi:T9SS C-terminal target domain-containing protein [bacterium]|nr:MAG: T9SS C-terminal target domain-containing protein [bacterium]
MKLLSRFSFLFLCAAILWSFTGVAQADSDYTEYKMLRNNYELGNPFTADAKARFELLNERFGAVREGTLDGNGGPDNYGYHFIDNMNGDTATYNWIELRDDVNAVWPDFGGPDDAGIIVPLNFFFPFYGVFHDEIRINSNGLIEFETTVSGWSNQCLPAPGLEGPAVFGFWDDLHMSYGGHGENTDNTIAYRDFGSYIVIQFDQIGHNGVGTPPTDSFTFEIILYSDGKIKFQYQEVEYDEYADSQTIGIQANAFGPSLQYACDANGTQVTNNRAVWFYLTNRGYLWGTITDEFGDPLPYVGVNLEGTEMYAHSDGAGEYFFPTIPIGQYNVHASLLGYEIGAAEGVSVVEGTPTTADIILDWLPSVRIPSTHAPVAITDLDTITASITTDISVYINAVGVRIDNLQHTYVDDLGLWLESPWGERISLSFRHGGSGENYVDTEFDDLAVRSLANGQAPFMGRFQPEEPLAPLAGQSSAGEWKLIVYDHANQDEGTLVNWSLILVGELTASGAVTGQITSAGAQPIEGAVVQAPGIGMATLTDATGHYSLELPPGTWDVRVSAFGYCDYTNENVAVQNNGTTPWNYTMQLADGEADVTTIDEEGIAGTTITTTFNFENTGFCDLDWSALSTSSGWLSVSPNSGTVVNGQPQEITVTMNATALSTGTYTGTITISSEGYSSPEIINVTLDLAEANGETPAQRPERFALRGNFPNPFNATTEIRYDVAKATHVTLTVYNLLGQEVRTLLDGFMEAGSHTAYWDGRNTAGTDLSTGIYIIQMQAENRRFTGKSMLIR